MFSGRVPDVFEPNALSAAVARKRSAGVPLIDLTETNPTRVGLSPSGAEIAAALAATSPGRYEPDAAGLASAREAVAAYHGARGARVAAGRIVLTASTSEAYAHLFKLLGNPGDAFLVPRPSYPLLEPLAALESVRLVPYALHYRGRWTIDLDEVAAAAPSARGLITVHPNNPTGSFVSLEEAAALEEICARAGIALIADEVFGDFAFEDAGPHCRTFAGAAAARAGTGAAAAPGRAGTSEGAVSGSLTFVLSGLSKTAGLPQMKLAWILCTGPDETVAAALARLEWIADAFLSVSTPVQAAAARLLALAPAFQERTRERTRANHAELAEAARRRPEFELLKVEGGWSAVLRVPRVRSEDDWALALLERGVLVHPGHFYDFDDEAYLVVSLLPPADVFAEGIARIAALVE